MRISDWSSDVCSSDLLALGWFAVAREPAEREPYREHGHDQDGGKNVQIGSPKTVRSTNLPPARPVDKGNILAAHAVSVIAEKGDRRCVLLDRKSVVEGKSVSVRVDYGGRRHIKKEKSRRSKGKKKK